ncbi:MAG: phage holin family protein [Bacteroidales bacterium]|jgi:putative membrane protein|nr:phage holin family protein [Bacteroidales bacterium]
MNKRNLQIVKFYVLKLFITTFAIVFSAWLLQKGIHIGDPKLLTGIIVAVVLLLINMFLKPIFVVLTIPFTLFSFGLFLLVINACVILLIDFLVDKFVVDSFWWALGFSMLVSLTNSLIEGISKLHTIQDDSQNLNSPDDDEI